MYMYLVIVYSFFLQWHDSGQWRLQRENHFLEWKTRNSNKGLDLKKNKIIKNLFWCIFACEISTMYNNFNNHNLHVRYDGVFLYVFNESITNGMVFFVELSNAPSWCVVFSRSPGMRHTICYQRSKITYQINICTIFLSFYVKT